MFCVVGTTVLLTTRSKIVNKIITMIIVGVFSVSLGLMSGCSTIKGFGKDVSKGGQEIQRAAS